LAIISFARVVLTPNACASTMARYTFGLPTSLAGTRIV
jgi:hypothetical protein